MEIKDGRSVINQSKTNHKKLHITIIILVVICLAAAAILIFVEGPKVMRSQVKGLTLTQEKLDIHATWNAMDCDGYTVTITADGKQTIISDYHETEYVIESVVPGTTYTVDVQGMLANGYNSRVSTESITAEKLKQKLTINISGYDGFKGDTFKIDAAGKGDVTFDSNKEKVADVDIDGNVKLNGKGHCMIKATVSGLSLIHI